MKEKNEILKSSSGHALQPRPACCKLTAPSSCFIRQLASLTMDWVLRKLWLRFTVRNCGKRSLKWLKQSLLACRKLCMKKKKVNS